MLYKNETFLILGMAKSGYSATKTLLSLGAKCYFYEDTVNKNFTQSLDELIRLGAINVCEKDLDEVLKKITVLLVSPGVPINHPICVKAKSLKKRIIGELELGSLLIKSPIIAVTGTNGKTTTVSMVAKILEEAKIKHSLVGNIGTPICSKVEELSDFSAVAVTEVSSFQLETVHSFLPHIACVLNVTPDHLERHYTMENYSYLKSRVFTNQRESEYAVLNADDLYYEEFLQKTRAKVLTFSLKNTNANAYCIDGVLYFGAEMIIREEDLFVKGEHNVMNALASICIAKALNIDTETISLALKNYRGAKHRIEYVGCYRDKNFYDDSKGTNSSSTISAIKCMNKPTVLILGGRDKGESYEELFTMLKDSNIVATVICGENSTSMLKTAVLCGLKNVSVVDNFDKAVSLAEFLTPLGGNVLLSPASSSFDRFSGYAERGEYFCKVVKGFEEKPTFDL